MTRNTEYHVRENRCVGVRDRESGEWCLDHGALAQEVAASITLLANGSMTAEQCLPVPGQRMIFEGKGSVLTGPVVAVKRPSKTVVKRYPGTNPGIAG